MLVLVCFHKECPLFGSYIHPIQVLILDQGGGMMLRMMQQVYRIQITVLYNSYLFVRVIYSMQKIILNANGCYAITCLSN
jgi:hypothetical protein